MIATRQGNVPVKKGDKLAGMRIIPLVIEKEKMQQIQEIVQKPILKIMPYQIKTAGIITTGSEVYKGRIKRYIYASHRRKIKRIRGRSYLP